MTKLILGGGLGGLSAAYYLIQTVPSGKVKIIEASSRLGGWIKTSHQENGILFEQGPRTIRPRGEAAETTLALVDALDLKDKIVPIPSEHPAARNRMIYAKGKLHQLPNSFVSLLKRQEPFSKPLIVYLLNDLIAKSKQVHDESIYDFINRRFGEEVADYLISPLICGICAGNAKEISVNFLMKNLFQYEQQFGNITLGILRNLWKKNNHSQNQNSLIMKAKKEKWSIYSFIDGFETLPIGLEKYIRLKDVEIHLNSPCRELKFHKNGIDLIFNDKEVNCEHIISSIPAETLGKLVQHQHPDLAKLLNRIQNISVAVVNLSFDKNYLENEAFGFLVAPKEEQPLLGVIYDSCCFPRSEGIVLTVMMGGYWFEKHFGKHPTDELVLNTALNGLNRILGIDEKPSRIKVNILEKCLPQYVVGHEENVNNISKYIKDHQLPLSLCGSSFYGVGVNDVIQRSKKVIENLP